MRGTEQGDGFVAMRPRGMFDQYCEKGRLELFMRGSCVLWSEYQVVIRFEWKQLGVLTAAL